MKLNIEQIKKLLHHREPYLLIDSVYAMDEKKIFAAKTIDLAKDVFLKGHFPGAPVLPGAMMQEMTTQAAGILLTKYYSPVTDYDSEKTKGHAIGVLSRVHYAKYLNFAKPGDELSIQVDLVEHYENRFKFIAKIVKDETTIMKNSFTLMNISDEYLF